MSVNLYIAKNDPRIVKLMPSIEAAYKRFVSAALPLLNIDWNFDMVVVNENINYAEYPVGGYTPTKYLVEIDIYSNAIKDRFEDYLFSTMTHEACHLKRYATMDYNDDLKGVSVLDYLIFEGLANNFQKEVLPNYTNQMKLYDRPDCARKIQCIVRPFYYKKYRDDLGKDGYNLAYGWFMYGDKEKHLPYGAGYILGDYLVSEYIRKHKTKASQIISTPAKNFAL